MNPLPDIQKTPDLRGVEIDQVGVTKIRLPIRVQRPGSVPHVDVPHLVDTVGEFEISCRLPAEVKGTHMSRFTEVLMEHLDKDGIFSHDQLVEVAKILRLRLDSTQVRIQVRMDYFVEQSSPSTEKRGIAPIKGVLGVTVTQWPGQKETVVLLTGVEADGKTCCPCSREISDYDEHTGRGKGAHAQRSHIQLRVEHPPTTMIWFESLLEICWAAFSSPVYPVLKRPDERAVTMAAYSNPKFVEDVARDVVVKLRFFRSDLHYFYVRVDNAESIHYHDAFAVIQGPATKL